jgi:hypothetical protein
MTDVWNKPKHAASNNARITAYKVIVNCLLIYPSEDVQMQLHTSCFPNVCFCSITAAGKLILATTQEQEKMQTLCMVGMVICFFTWEDTF